MARKKATNTASKTQLEIPQIKSDFEIKELKWTKKQQDLINLGQDKQTNIIFCSAPAGVGKTIISLRIGLGLLKSGSIEKIYFCRQPKESSLFGLGYIKGSVEEKMTPYTYPMFDNLNELMWSHQIPDLIKNKDIEVVPVGFLKGRTFNNCLFIIDEAEDLLFNDFRLCLTRIGKNSKMIFIGDPGQSNVKNNGFGKIFNTFNNEESQKLGIFCLEFSESEILRNPIISYILQEIKKTEKKV